MEEVGEEEVTDHTPQCGVLPCAVVVVLNFQQGESRFPGVQLQNDEEEEQEELEPPDLAGRVHCLSLWLGTLAVAIHVHFQNEMGPIVLLLGLGLRAGCGLAWFPFLSVDVRQDLLIRAVLCEEVEEPRRQVLCVLA